MNFVPSDGLEQNITFQTSLWNNTTFHSHSHSSYEFYYFVDGDADYQVEGKIYHLTPHSLVLLSPYVFHGLRVSSTKPYTRCVIYVQPEFIPFEYRSLLLSIFPGNQKENQKEVFYENTKEFGILSFLEKLVALQDQDISNKACLSTILLDALLAQVYIMSQTLHPSQAYILVPENITRIIDYINQHLTEEVSLDVLSERFFLSKHYMNRAFKKATGTTIINYIIHKRVIMACHLMQEGNSASVAAFQSGFHDYSVFYRAYKNIFGHSPTNRFSPANKDDK